MKYANERLYTAQHLLFVDGGVIGRNPSEIGGTWAARLIYADQIVDEQSGVITPQQAGLPAITNNLTEMAALVKGLRMLPSNWRGVICSDSQITLGRAFDGWRWAGIPDWLYRAFGYQVKRLVHWEKIDCVLLAGHPTKAQLAEGTKNGLPVSIHNVAVDRLCKEQAERVQREEVQP